MHCLMKKITGILSLLSILALTFSCARYQLVSMSYQEFRNDSLKKSGTEVVFVDDGINVYKLNHAELSAESVSGEPELVGRTGENRFVKERNKDKHVNCVTIFVRHPIHVQTDQSGPGKVYQEKKIILDKNEISRVKAYAMDPDYIALIVVGSIVLLLILAVVAFFVLLDMAMNASNSNGCYIATMVYGDYDAPEVKVLRNFRDNVLAKYIAGVIFIKVYYRFSPLFVERFKDSPAVNRFIKEILDRVVKKLS
jgi:hypothetical protein